MQTENEKKYRRWAETAEKMQKSIDSLRRPRETHTPKKAKQAMKARFEANNQDRARIACLALANAYLNNQVPSALSGLKSRLEVETLMRHGFTSSGYYHIADSGEYADTSEAGIALQALTDKYISSCSGIKAEMDKNEMKTRLEEAMSEIGLADIDGYFPTPINVVDHLIDLAELEEKHSVLEPSAGTGNIAFRVIERHNIEPKCIEIRHKLVEVLKLKGLKNVECADFLEREEVEQFDRIIMNPPFERKQDITHVKHAFNWLAPGGRLVSVMSGGPKPEYFKLWLESNNADIIPLERNSFKESGTSVNAIIVVLNKA